MKRDELIELLASGRGPFAVDAIETFSPDGTLRRQLRSLAGGPWPLDEEDATTDARVVALVIVGLLRDEKAVEPVIELLAQIQAETWERLEALAASVLAAIGAPAVPHLVDRIERIESEHDIASYRDFELDSAESNLYYEYWGYVEVLGLIAEHHPDTHAVFAPFAAERLERYVHCAADGDVPGMLDVWLGFAADAGIPSLRPAMEKAFARQERGFESPLAGTLEEALTEFGKDPLTKIPPRVILLESYRSVLEEFEERRRRFAALEEMSEEEWRRHFIAGTGPFEGTDVEELPATPELLAMLRSIATPPWSQENDLIYGLPLSALYLLVVLGDASDLDIVMAAYRQAIDDRWEEMFVTMPYIIAALGPDVVPGLLRLAEVIDKGGPDEYYSLTATIAGALGEIGAAHPEALDDIAAIIAPRLLEPTRDPVDPLPIGTTDEERERHLQQTPSYSELWGLAATRIDHPLTNAALGAFFDRMGPGYVSPIIGNRASAEARVIRRSNRSMVRSAMLERYLEYTERLRDHAHHAATTTYSGSAEELAAPWTTTVTELANDERRTTDANDERRTTDANDERRTSNDEKENDE